MICIISKEKNVEKKMILGQQMSIGEEKYLFYDWYKKMKQWKENKLRG